MTSSSSDLCAAEFLEGVELPGGWIVRERIPDGATGGNFGVPYIVEKNDLRKGVQRAFLKALNLRRLAGEPDFSRALQRHTTAFNFERDILSLCKEKGMKRIARLIDAGEHRLPSSSLPICYIIFELAESGDVRSYLSRFEDFNLGWTLRTLHQVSVAMRQLHKHGIAHQDLKPSNVLIFESFGAKVGDLGCADSFSEPSNSPHGNWHIAGDPSYAPPELFYNEVAMDWETRRLGCDLYLLGSIIVFFFTGGASMTALWRRNLSAGHQPGTWQHDYRTALPYVRDAFEKAFVEFKKSIPTSVAMQVTEMVRHLCEPDPRLRGHPHDRRGSQFNLERFISTFNFLATKAELGLLGA
jgi:serine/threonine protein kinase